MDQSLSSEDGQNLRQSDVESEWLGESHFTALIINDVSECLSMLSRKRATLEEKIIARELHKLVAAYGRILAVVHDRLAAQDNPQEEMLEKVRTFNYEVRQQIDRLLNALRYNLNYLEQYFEYDFSCNLSQNWHFAETAEQLCHRLGK
jgi:hypothetical protein